MSEDFYGDREQKPMPEAVRRVFERQALGLVPSYTEAEAEARLAQMEAQAGVRPDWSRQDHIESLRDGLLIAAGKRNFRAHPLAVEHFSDQLAPLNLRDAVSSIAALNGAPVSTMSPAQIVSAALSTGDVPSIASQVAEVLSNARQSRALAGLVAATTRVELQSFLPSAYLTAEVGDMPTPVYSDPTDRSIGSVVSAHVYASGLSVQVASAAANLIIGRQVLINGDLEAVLAGFQGWTNAATKVEFKMFADLLSGNANLGDGNPWFTGDNAITAALDSAGLGAARAALRDYPSEDGNAADLAAKTLICGSADEQAALELTEALPANRRLDVLSLANLAGDKYYLVSDPMDASTIARCTVVGSNGNSLSFEPSPSTLSTDGTGVRCRHDVGYQPLSRAGIVEVTKA